MTSSNQENPLSRWSRRKQQALSETEQEDQLIDLQQQQLLSTEAGITQNLDVETVPEEATVVLTDEDMPPLTSLNENSDFSGFMSSGVSDELRNLALRKLFKAPSFNIRDGLDEYDEDYTSFEKLGDLVTCDMKHQIEMEAKKKLEEEANKLSEDDKQEQTESPSLPQEDPSQQEVKTSHQTQQPDAEITVQPFTETAETPPQSTAQPNE